MNDINETESIPEYDWQKPRQPFEFGRVMGRSFAGFFKNIGPILLACVLLLIVQAAWSIPFYGGFGPEMFEAQTSSTTAHAPAIAGVVSGIITIFSMMFICIFTDIHCYATFRDEQVSFRNVMNWSARATLPILFICIIYVIAMCVGLIFLIIPGIIISLGWMVIGPAYLHERIGLFDTFSRAWYLSSGYKWWLFLASIVFNLVVTFIMLALLLLLMALVIAIFGDIFSNENPAPMTPAAALSVSGLFSFYMYISLAFTASFVCAVYTELRDIKDGT